MARTGPDQSLRAVGSVTRMILLLDDERCLDPTLAGAKAAWLARGLHAGLPVLPGVVVAAPASSEAMRLGVEVMGRRGSGGARLVIGRHRLPIQLSQDLAAAVSGLPEPLVVRSSSLLEGDGRWAGAFTSYLDIRHSEVEVAVLGCWASAFTVHTLARYEGAAVDPGSVPMAVLIQPALLPDFGGTARIAGDDVLVVGVAGSPAPLVQGWEPGAHARVGATNAVSGAPAIELMNAARIVKVASLLRSSRKLTGASSCEWAITGDTIHLLQLLRSIETGTGTIHVPPALATDQAGRVARMVRRAPGPMGEALVLPWAIGCADPIDTDLAPMAVDPVEALVSATGHARTLTTEVWGTAEPAAAAKARETLRELRSSRPAGALEAIATLRMPDPERVGLVLGLLAQVRRGLVSAGAIGRPELGWHVEPGAAAGILVSGRAGKLRTRIGFDRWEPFDAGVVIGVGRSATGTAAAPGVGCGRLCWIEEPGVPTDFRPRDVVVSRHPVAGLAALLWDAAGIVTTGGGAAAHLFESARALAIPAVCAIDLDEALGMPVGRASGRFSMAIDGVSGTVHLAEW